MAECRKFARQYKFKRDDGLRKAYGQNAIYEDIQAHNAMLF